MKLSAGNISGKDLERAVLPTIIWAHKSVRLVGGVRQHAAVLGIGWWKWGIRISHNWRRAIK